MNLIYHCFKNAAILLTLLCLPSSNISSDFEFCCVDEASTRCQKTVQTAVTPKDDEK